MRDTPALSLPLCRSRAQCDGVRGALLSHLLTVSARIPTTPFPSIVIVCAFPSLALSLPFCLCVLVGPSKKKRREEDRKYSNKTKTTLHIRMVTTLFQD
uniref:Uncharacterized protein n=1 Tax=Rhizophora mucronata TaxID=61149 RepID=A0A2P2NQR4_RHIMU